MSAPPNSWQAVQDEVLRRIHSRDWAPGETIPTEAELARELGCARATVNRALRGLAEAGLLERRRRAGTRVAALPVRHARLRIPILRHEIEALPARYGYELLSRRMAAPPGDLRAAPGAPPGDMLYLEAVHRADGAAFAHEARWLNVGAVPAAADTDFTALSANEWLVRNVPVSEGRIEFLAEAASPDEARLFGCAIGTALFRADRRTWNEGRLITFVRQTFRPGYRLETRI